MGVSRPPDNSSLALWAFRELRELSSTNLGETNSFDSSVLLDKNSIINRSKYEGFFTWDSTLKKPLWAKGKGRSDPWVDSSGTTVHTPT